MFGTFIITAILASCNFVYGELYLSCYEYETHCLFSFGPNVTVNNVKEAQRICEDAKHGSWPLEISDGRVLNSLEKFVQQHFFPANAKFILNAEIVKNSWRWIRDGADIIGTTDKMLRVNGEVKYYKDQLKKGQYREGDNFVVICMADCRSTFKEVANISIEVGYHQTDFSQRQCREECEVSDCDAWGWETDSLNNGCWIYSKSHFRNGPIKERSGSTLYIVDKSMKITGACLGVITVPGFRHQDSNCCNISKLNPGFIHQDSKVFNISELNPGFRNQDSNVCNISELNLILVHLIPLVLLAVVLLVVTFVLWRKFKNRQLDPKDEFYLTTNTTVNIPSASVGKDIRCVIDQGKSQQGEQTLETDYHLYEHL